ncbi:MAG: hypothetical protein DI620_05945 [Haemophilus parainfluenzae]|nr:MAG: hypothetical protein DI620_05945 [Haemophilus parainfluenzae]
MRQAFIERQTRETSIRLQLNLDGTGKAELKTGVPFLEHMLEQICAHGLIDIKLYAEGDLEVDLHHTVEDIGIVLGQGSELSRRHSSRGHHPRDVHAPSRQGLVAA